MANLGPRADVRVRVSPKGKRAKNCPAIRLRNVGGPVWEYYDKDSDAWVEPYLDEPSSVQLVIPLPLKDTVACK